MTNRLTFDAAALLFFYASPSIATARRYIKLSAAVVVPSRHNNQMRFIEVPWWEFCRACWVTGCAAGIQRQPHRHGLKAMQRDKIKPIPFSIIKDTDKEELRRQIPKDIVSGIVVAVVALPPPIALTIASGVAPE